MGPLPRLGLVARRGFSRLVPDPLVIAIVLTALVFVGALGSGRGAVDVLGDWGGGKGLWALLKFTMQMCTMLVLGGALAAAPGVRRAIAAAAGAARSPRGLVGLTAAASIALALLNWSLCVVGGALFARIAGSVAKRRGWTVHYPLLCAAGYSGMMVWHGGLSGSAPLKSTTAADMAEVLGETLASQAGVVPLSESVFGSLNLLVSLGLLVLGPLLFMALTPAQGDDPEASAAPDDPPPEASPLEAPSAEGRLERFERSGVHVWLLASATAAALALSLSRSGVAGLDFNTVNLALWCLALLAHGRLDRFVAACEGAISGCTGIVIQFPLYAGIMGVMAGSGLSTALSKLFVAAGQGAFTTVAFLAAGLLNLFVPSGGGQWAVQGPILVQGALELGLPVSDVLMAMAYGDQWTNMLQPFWALPLLAITGVRARDIVGYASLWMAFGGAWILVNLWLWT
ncbi:MAG: TIGR00366 family protein [Myxococcota bacterium]